MYRDELKRKLLDIDEEASLVFGDLDEKLDAVVVGGSVFILRSLTERVVTHDIDIFEMDARLRSIISVYPEVNEHSAIFCNQMPYNYPDRLVEIDLDTRAVRYLSPSLEDLAVMKLYAYRPNDRSDLNSPNFVDKLDWDKLDHLVYSKDEALASSPSERSYAEMVCAYKIYRKEHGK